MRLVVYLASSVLALSGDNFGEGAQKGLVRTPRRLVRTPGVFAASGPCTYEHMLLAIAQLTEAFETMFGDCTFEIEV